MRADRLIALLLLLQRRGRITAAEAAAELEVSERTARRDLEALAMSGVPVYSRHGRGGGWQLIGGASTDLTGLSADEARALFLAAGPGLADRPELRRAIRKLSAALPDTFRDEAEAASAAVKVDTNGWGQIGPWRQPRFLDELTDAVVSGRQVRLDYRDRMAKRGRRTIHPLGLVTKRNTWYLVADTDHGLRTFRVARVEGVEALDEPARRPPDFDLDRAWEEIVTEVEARRMPIETQALIDPAYLTPARYRFGSHLVVEGERDGRVEVTLAAHSPTSMASQLAGFGAAVELVDPPTEVGRELARIGAELCGLYESGRVT